MKLADALLRRKELQQKVDQTRSVKGGDIYEPVIQRRQINEQLDEITGKVNKLELNQVTEEFDYYANKLRLIDAAIQQLNWTTEIEVSDKVWVDFAESKKPVAVARS